MPNSFRTILLSILALGGGSLLFAACEGGTAVDTAGPPAAVSHAGGNAQSGVVAEELVQPISARVEDADGNPVEGVEVRWQVTAGGGTVTSSSTTSASGQAKAAWTLGTVAGEQKATASVQGAGSVDFTAVAEPGPATALSVSTDTLSFDALGSVDSIPLEAEDEYGNAIEAGAAHWVSLDAAVASVDAGGRVSSVGNGATGVVGSMGDLADTVEVVVAQVAAALVLHAPADTLQAFDATVELGVEAEDANGNALPASEIAWSSLDTSIVALDGAGLATARGNGSADVVVTASALSDTAAVHVRQIATTLAVGVDVDSLHAIADTVPFAVLGEDANGHSVEANAVTWLSADTTIVVVTTHGEAVSRGNGTADVVAQSGDAADTVTLVVDQIATSIHIEPSADSVVVGDTLSLKAEATDSNGIAVDAVDLVWSSNDTTVIGGDPALMARAAGRTELVVAAGDISATVEIIVGHSFIQIATSNNHTCGITADGDAYCWGRNMHGALGDETQVGRLSPVLVSGSHAWVSVAPGSSHTCGLTTSGNAYCWGYGESGQLGNGTTDSHLTPILVAGGHTWSAIDPASSHTCGITTSGDAYCWGADLYGQLGLGGTAPETCTNNAFTYDCSTSPALVDGGHNWSVVEAGSPHTCGITTSAEAYCWGMGQYGALGNGDLADQSSPVLVAGAREWSSLTARTRHSCGVTTAGEALCWGEAEGGRLGAGSVSGIQGTPIAVSGSSDWVSVSAGFYHTCGLKASGEIYCWGTDTHGQLGNGEAGDQLEPAPESTGTSWMSLTAGTRHTCGITETGKSYCWGEGSSGQLGNGTMEDQQLPVFVHEP